MWGQLHERLGLGSNWQLFYLPVLAPLFLLLWLVGGWEGRDARRTMRIGLVVLAVSLFLGRAAEPLLVHGHWGPGTAPYEVKVVLKQGAEVVGWGMVAASLLALALPLFRAAHSRTLVHRPSATVRRASS